MEKILVSILIVEPDVLLEHVSIAAIPPVKKTDTTVLIICCSLVGIIGFGAALMFLHKRRNQMNKRRCASTVYKRTIKDDEEEGTPLE